ncbi:S-adenosyl methyltransferase [Actinomadura meyerae]|uniref:S-adenosyl methyltransferase n=1 Tax=Actinomadura meyerae TaxID=240840 RepID=A0A239KBJ8_9ACTN|nr:SAM-dependent methyltransferase [Actinomadura meyerae]SNT14484.1 S-adenosyl methyltransferase [Actinomadura meyerae]
MTKIDQVSPHFARIFDYWLSGKDNYGIDQEVGDAVSAVLPEAVDAALHNRAFLCRAVHYLAAEAGIRQFLDIGCGMPGEDNTHEVAQRIIPQARVVYVDNDPLVLAHARALLTSSPEGSCDHVDADARDAARILTEASRTLDLGQPIAVMMLGVLNHLDDLDEAWAAVQQLLALLAPGSHLVITHPTAELHGDRVHQAMRLAMDLGCGPIVARSLDEIASFFVGLEVLEPGVVPCSRWRPDPWVDAPAVLQYCGVARKAAP